MCKFKSFAQLLTLLTTTQFNTPVKPTNTAQFSFIEKISENNNFDLSQTYIAFIHYATNFKVKLNKKHLLKDAGAAPFKHYNARI